MIWIVKFVCAHQPAYEIQFKLILPIVCDNINLLCFVSHYWGNKILQIFYINIITCAWKKMAVNCYICFIVRSALILREKTYIYHTLIARKKWLSIVLFVLLLGVHWFYVNKIKICKICVLTDINLVVVLLLNCWVNSHTNNFYRKKYQLFWKFTKVFSP